LLCPECFHLEKAAGFSQRKAHNVERALAMTEKAAGFSPREATVVEGALAPAQRLTSGIIE
jgi:hypothetical protein